MFNLQGTLLVMSSSPPLPTSPPPHAHPWLTMGGSNRAVTVPKCLSWSGFPCGGRAVVSYCLFCFLLWDGRRFQRCCGLAQSGRGDAGHLLRGEHHPDLQLAPCWLWRAAVFDATGMHLADRHWIQTGDCGRIPGQVCQPPSLLSCSCGEN